MSSAAIFLALAFIGFSVYLMLRMKRRDSSMEVDSRGASYDRAYKRLSIGMLIGFMLGCVVAMTHSPPFRGMMDASSEEEGFFAVASWFVGGLIGAIFGAVVGLMTSGSRRKE